MDTNHIYNSTDLHRQDYVDCEDPILRELAAFRLRLLSNGYEPIPTGGKGHLNTGWTSDDITPERVQLETENGTAKLNTGLRRGRTAVVDNDLRDPEHAAAVNEIIEHVLGPTPLKRRGSKGAALCYRNETPISKLTISDAEGTRLFEILGTGQQFVAYGMHPKGMDYTWIGEGEPATVTLDDLPEVTPEQLYTLHSTIHGLLVDLGYELKTEEPRPEKHRREDDSEDIQGTYVNGSYSDDDAEQIERKAAAAIAVIPNNMTYEEWLDVGMALKSAFEGNDAEGYRLWEQFSLDYPSNTVKVIQAKWRSFRPRSITAATLFHFADENDPDWRKPFMNGFAGSEFVANQHRDYLEQLEEEQSAKPDQPVETEEYRGAASSQCEECEPLQTEAEVAVWPEPMDIFGALTHEPILTPDMLPEKIREFVYDQSELLGCDPGAMAVTALAICSSLISDAITIQPKRFDTTYLESARLWLMLIGQISNKKSPMLKKLTDIIRTTQAKMKRQYDLAKEKYRNQLDVYEAKRKSWIAQRAKGDTDAGEPAKPEKPREPRLLTNDYTNEGLAEILCDNPRGILILMDEIMALFGGFDAYKAGKVNKDRPVTLEGYNGGPKDIDRKGSKDDRIHVPNWSFSIVGGIQHSKLDEIGAKLGDDGLLQRFILMPMEPPKIGVDRTPCQAAITEYTALVANLIGHNPTNPKPILLSEGAHKYREQIDELVGAFESFHGLSEAFQAYAGKFGGTFARLLLTMHVIETSPTLDFINGLTEPAAVATVSEETARRTYDIMTKFLIPHAIRQYERLDTKGKCQSVEDARSFGGYILSKGLTQVNKRVLHDASKELRKKDRAGKVIEFLTAAGWIRDGEVNPRVHEIYAERAAYERKTRAERHARIQRGRNTIQKVYGSMGTVGQEEIGT
jgi:hypothetical protein